MKKFIVPVLLIMAHFGFAQTIHYDFYSNDKLIPNGALTVHLQNGITYLSAPDARIKSFLDYNRKKQVTIMEFEGEMYKTVVPFDSLTKPSFSQDPEVILGYKTRKATFSSFSNTIETWFTEEAGVSGSPNPSFIPTDKALVLKMVMNGNRKWVASNITKNITATLPEYAYEKAKTVSVPVLEAFKIRSRYTTLSVFKNERINFEELPKPPKSGFEFDKTYRFSSGTIIMKKIRLPESAGKETQIFADLKVRSDGDAYDRTGSVFMVPVHTEKCTLLDALIDSVGIMPSFTDKRNINYHGFVSDTHYEVPVEWMRFFTSFGVGNFNNRRIIDGYEWEPEAAYKQDVTQLLPSDAKEIWVGVFIGNYDRGGHIVSLDLNFYPGGERESHRYVQPLFNTVNVMEMSGQHYARLFRTDTLRIPFHMPAGLKDGFLLFTSTGHGGWGNGDEFQPRLNRLLLDGKEFFSVIPWRTDCATYRLYNPASGNFADGLSSSDLSRSNWCPAMITYPYQIPLRDVPPGDHVLELIIDQGADEGSSFSFWSTSGMLTGTLER